MENREEKKDNRKRDGGKLKNERKSYKMSSFFFFFVLFCLFVLFCFFHFSKPLKFVLGLPNWEFSTRKKHFTSGKKSGKMTLPPLKNMYSYAPVGKN